MNTAVTPTLKAHTHYFPALTGVRALAAFLVYAHHMRPPEGILPDFLHIYLTAGHIGVTIFFVLSGFLIAFRYENALTGKPINFLMYFLRRAARIYPLYFLLTVVMLLWQNNGSLWHWLLNLSLLKGFFDAEKFTGIAQGWSLTVEESFYLLAPLLFWGFRKIGISTLVLLIVFGSLLVIIAKMAGSTSFLNSYGLMMGMSIFGRCFEFYCGYRLARYLKSGPVIHKETQLFTWLGSLATLAGLLAIGYTTGLKFIFDFQVSPSLIINNFVFPLGISVWFYGLITERTFFSKLLGTKLFQVLGKSSYAFYLIHLGWFFEVFFFHVHASRITTFFFLIACSIAIYYLFEEPVNQYIRRKFDARELRKKLKQQPDFSGQKA